ncbi:MAG: hypothetical protein WBP72_13680 [Rhodocyclaceae bacterium]
MPNPLPPRPDQRPAPPAVQAPDQPADLPRPSAAVRVLGWVLLAASLGFVSCQALFVP